jgi:hypothetical protein
LPKNFLPSWWRRFHIATSRADSIGSWRRKTCLRQAGESDRRYSFFVGSRSQSGGCDLRRSVRLLEVTQEVVPQVLWQLDIEDQWAYRAVRIPSLYPGVTW